MYLFSDYGNMGNHKFLIFTCKNDNHSSVSLVSVSLVSVSLVSVLALANIEQTGTPLDVSESMSLTKRK